MKNQKKTDGLLTEGLSSLSEYLRAKPHVIKKIYVRTEDALKQLNKLLASLAVNFENPIVKVWQEGDQDFMVSAPIWAELDLSAKNEKEYEKIWGERTKDFIIALDHITDPRNLVAIVRTAAFFGLKEVIVPERRQVLLTNASVNTSQGGFAHTDLIVVGNLPRTIENLKEKGYWILGADMEGKAFQELRGFYEKVVLVLGAEDTGISDLVRKKTDLMISIKGAMGGVESLNVSVAAGILIAGLTP